MKICTGCGESKPLEAFHPDKRIACGRIARCRECVSARRAAHKAANLELVRERNREKVRRWRQANPELARKQSTAASRRLRARERDYFRNWYWANVEKERKRLREGMRRWREEHPDEERARKRRYRAANIDLVREREREKTYQRRAQIAASPETAHYMTQLLQEPCAYCGTTEDITVDHIIPLVRGGKHEPANLAPACRSCNSSKCALLLDEWAGPPALRRTAS